MPVAVPLPAVSDADLAQRAGRGDATAFTALYARHRAPLERFVTSRARDPELAAEVVQLTFARAWAALRAGAAPERPRAWLYAIARNATVDELRARDRTRPAGDPETVGAGPAGRAEDDPEAALREKELTELLWAAAESLPTADRELLELHVRRGLDVEALAARLHVRARTMHTRLCRMRAALREAIVCELVMRRGGRACPVVAALLARSDPAPQLRGAVRRHVRECECCRAFAHPSAILAGLLPLPALARACERAARRRAIRRLAIACALLLTASLAVAGPVEPADMAPAGARFAETRAIEPLARTPHVVGHAPVRARGRRAPKEPTRPRARAAATRPAPTAAPPATAAPASPSHGTPAPGPTNATRPRARVLDGAPSAEARVLDGAQRRLPLPVAKTAPSAEPVPAPPDEAPAAVEQPESPQPPPPPDPGDHPEHP